MGFFTEFRNECLIRELERELNTDVLLFGIDGFTYFGNLQKVEGCRIATLTPAIEAETSSVEILTPGGELVTVNFLRVDLWSIVGKGTGIANDPIEPLGSSCVNPRSTNSVSEERQESHELIRQLCRMIGDCVTITTLGGFLFEGVLGDVDDELAILTVDEIFVPGTSSRITDNNVRSVVVNLEALTSVATQTSCKGNSR